MPSDGGKAGLLGPYLIFNPFYHFLETVRAPILGNPIEPLSWAVVLVTTIIGMLAAYLFNLKFSKQLVTWI